MINKVQSYFIRKRLNTAGGEKMDIAWSDSIGVLYNEDKSDREELKQLIKTHFEANQTKVYLLGFTRHKFDDADRTSFIVNKNDFSIFGQPKSEVLLKFIKLEFKLLFNFFEKGDYFLEYIAKQASAKLKVGFSESNQNINDLVLGLDSNDLSLFKESSKYIKRII